jgi:2-acylglycerol O-acyltransferase 2
VYAYFFVDLSELYCGWSNVTFRESIVWKFFARRFQIKAKKTTELEGDKSYIFGLHPHGILPLGGLSGPNGFKALFPTIPFRVLVASFCFYMPVYREILLASGAIDASRFSAMRALKKGYSLVLVPGGGIIIKLNG